jgi:hypothetical protein
LKHFGRPCFCNGGEREKKKKKENSIHGEEKIFGFANNESFVKIEVRRDKNILFFRRFLISFWKGGEKLKDMNDIKNNFVRC